MGWSRSALACCYPASNRQERSQWVVVAPELTAAGRQIRSQSQTPSQAQEGVFHVEPERYDPQQVEPKWAAAWEERQLYRADDGDATRPRFYALDMFPYPSGDLHMGHLEAFSGGDVIARLRRMQGYRVLHPIGWDSFGLPAENAAIRRNEHPADYTYANIQTQAQSFKQYAVSFDWDRVLYTSDPEYYRWNQ